jgi:hypothetical protein
LDKILRRGLKKPVRVTQNAVYTPGFCGFVPKSLGFVPASPPPFPLFAKKAHTCPAFRHAYRF